MAEPAPIVATYSIAACDLDAGQWGVATQSKFLAVGSVVPWAEPHVGAIATQAYANPRYGPDGLALLREGLSAEEVVERLTAADDGRDHRQLGVVDAHGGSASFTGSRVHGLGRRQHRAVLRGAGEHPRRRGDGRRARRRRSRRRRAGRSPSACSSASPRRRRREATAGASSPPRSSSSSATAATRPLGRPRRPAHRRPPGAGRRARAASTGCTTCCSARRRASSGSTVDGELARRARASGSRASATTASSTTRSGAGRAPRTSRSASTAVDRIDPVVLAELRGSG